MELHMTKKKAAVLGGVAVVAALGITGAAIGSSDDDSTQKPITGTALQKASEAALAETGGGKVTETEVDESSGAPLFAEAQGFDRHDLRDREWILELRDIDLFQRLSDARIAITLARGLGEVRPPA